MFNDITDSIIDLAEQIADVYSLRTSIKDVYLSVRKMKITWHKREIRFLYEFNQGYHNGFPFDNFYYIISNKKSLNRYGSFSNEQSEEFLKCSGETINLLDFVLKPCCDSARKSILKNRLTWRESWMTGPSSLNKAIENCEECLSRLPLLDKIGFCEEYSSNGRFWSIGLI